MASTISNTVAANRYWLTGGIALPSATYASDFSVLFVVLGVLLISVINAVISFKAAVIVVRQGINQAIGYLFSMLLLSLVGVTLIFNETRHMADSDFYGSLAILLTPAFLSLFVMTGFQQLKRLRAFKNEHQK